MYYLNILYCNVLSEDSCPASGPDRLWDLRGAPKKKKGQKKGQYLAYYLEGYWGTVFSRTVH